MKLQEKINIYLVTKPIFAHVMLFIFIFICIKSIYYIFINQEISWKYFVEVVEKNIDIIIKSVFILLVFYVMHKSIQYIKKKVQSIINYLYESERCSNPHKRKAIIVLMSLIIISIYYLIELGSTLTTLSTSIFSTNTLINDAYMEHGQTCMIFLCEKYNLPMNKEYLKIIMSSMDYMTFEAQKATFLSILEIEIKKNKYLEYLFFFGLNLIIVIYFVCSTILKEKIIRRITVLRIYCLLLLLLFMCLMNFWFWLNIIIFHSALQIFVLACIFLPILLIFVEYIDHRKQKGKNYFKLFYWILFICLFYLYFYLINYIVEHDRILLEDLFLQEKYFCLQIKYTNLFKINHIQMVVQTILQSNDYLLVNSSKYITLNGIAYETIFSKEILHDYTALYSLLSRSFFLVHGESLTEMYNNISAFLETNLWSIQLSDNYIEEKKIEAHYLCEELYQKQPAFSKAHYHSKAFHFKKIEELIDWNKYLLTVDSLNEKVYIKKIFYFYFDNCPKEKDIFIFNTFLDAVESKTKFITPIITPFLRFSVECISFLQSHVSITVTTDPMVFLKQLIRLYISYEKNQFITIPYMPPQGIIDNNPLAIAQVFEGYIITPTQRQQLQIEGALHCDQEISRISTNIAKALISLEWDSQGLYLNVIFLKIRLI